MQAQPRKILLISKPAIGDALLATPLIHSIRQAHPDAQIDLLVYAGQEPIVEGNPDLDNVLSMSQHPRPAELWTAIRSMWRRYDIGIANAADDRAHLYLWAFARKRVAVHIASTAAWKRWITFAAYMEDERGTHALLRNNALGDLLGIAGSYRVTTPRAVATEPPNPVLAEIAARDRDYAVLHLEARLPYKRWTEQGWRDLAAHLASLGLEIYLTGGGGAAENDYLEQVFGGSAQVTASVAGKLSFAESAELIGNSKLYVGIDTVNSHIAAALGVPTIALFGPESPYRWGPWPAGLESAQSPWSSDGTQRHGNVMIVQSAQGCEDCRQTNCLRRHDGRSGCPLMTGISSAQVIDAASSMLSDPAQACDGGASS